MKVAFGNGKLRALFQGKGRRELDRRIFYCCAHAAGHRSMLVRTSKRHEPPQEPCQLTKVCIGNHYERAKLKSAFRPKRTTMAQVTYFFPRQQNR